MMAAWLRSRWTGVQIHGRRALMALPGKFLYAIINCIQLPYSVIMQSYPSTTARRVSLGEAARVVGTTPSKIAYWVKRGWVDVLEPSTGPGRPMYLDLASVLRVAAGRPPRRRRDARTMDGSSAPSEPAALEAAVVTSVEQHLPPGDGPQFRNWVPKSSDVAARASGVQILVFGDVFRDIQEHASTDLEKEVAGFLLGRVRDADGAGRGLVTIEAAITAKHVVTGPTHVEFSHRTWTELHREREEDFGNLPVVGWYHTHPSIGIFLSRYDVFIHRGFFTRASDVALVLDPVQHHAGFFVWSGNELDPHRYQGFLELSMSAERQPTRIENLAPAYGPSAQSEDVAIRRGPEVHHDEAPVESLARGTTATEAATGFRSLLRSWSFIGAPAIAVGGMTMVAVAALAIGLAVWARLGGIEAAIGSR